MATSVKVTAGDEIKAEHHNSLVDVVAALEDSVDNIPAGPKGDTGPQGPKGDKGDTGAQGTAGAKGDTGAKGSDGLSIKSIALSVDAEGKVTGGEATMSNDSKVAITVA